MLFFSTTTRYSVCAERKWRHITSSLADADIVPAPAAVGLCKQNTTRQMLLVGLWGRWWCANETGISQRWLIYPSLGPWVEDNKQTKAGSGISTKYKPSTGSSAQTRKAAESHREVLATHLRAPASHHITAQHPGTARD
jgi:hypothetical protein